MPEAEKSELYGPGIPPVRLQLSAEGIYFVTNLKPYMNQAFIYDFKTREIVNPLDKIVRFYVNPFMPHSAQALNVEQLWNESFGSNTDSEVKFVNGIPVIVFPLNLLKLERASIRISSSDKYVITTDKLVLYIKLFSATPYLCRIDTVLIK